MIGNCVITIGKNTVRAFLRTGTQGPVAGLKRRISPWGCWELVLPQSTSTRLRFFAEARYEIASERQANVFQDPLMLAALETSLL